MAQKGYIILEDEHGKLSDIEYFFKNKKEAKNWEKTCQKNKGKLIKGFKIVYYNIQRCWVRKGRKSKGVKK